MLAHAFETWKLRRVEFKTSTRNEKSRNALLRVGAVQEGIFRHHMTHADGSLRDTVYFSILRDEWPAVKTKLRARLDAGS
jgi:RimJ/RimL family protein N-acetyltransferase